MPIVWVNPDGSLRITVLAPAFLAAERRPDEPTDAAVLRLARERVRPKDPALTGLTPVLVRRAAMPPDRSQRHAWRLNGQTVVVPVPAPVKTP